MLGSCDLSVGLGKVLLLERVNRGTKRAESAPGLEAAELVLRDTEPRWSGLTWAWMLSCRGVTRGFLGADTARAGSRVQR